METVEELTPPLLHESGQELLETITQPLTEAQAAAVSVITEARIQERLAEVTAAEQVRQIVSETGESVTTIQAAISNLDMKLDRLINLLTEPTRENGNESPSTVQIQPEAEPHERSISKPKGLLERIL